MINLHFTGASSDHHVLSSYFSFFCHDAVCLVNDCSIFKGKIRGQYPGTIFPLENNLIKCVTIIRSSTQNFLFSCQREVLISRIIEVSQILEIHSTMRYM